MRIRLDGSIWGQKLKHVTIIPVEPPRLWITHTVSNGRRSVVCMPRYPQQSHNGVSQVSPRGTLNVLLTL